MNENTSLEFSISIQLAVKIAHVVKLLLTRNKQSGLQGERESGDNRHIEASQN